MTILHFVFLGLLLGWGAAIPVGPINLEMTRRNLTYGTSYGTSFGMGACFADMTYLVLLAFGLLTLLQYPLVVKVTGLVGSVILLWFGVKALQASSQPTTFKGGDRSMAHNTTEGYLFTLLNPFTVLFWGSIGTQLPHLSEGGEGGILWAGLGVFIATVSWVLGLNVTLHFTRHKLSEKFMKMVNLLGGLIVIGFALYGLVRTIKLWVL